jgi:hypothetical protein
MVKITKRVVEAAEAQEKDYLIWDDELPGFGLRVFGSGNREGETDDKTSRSNGFHPLRSTLLLLDSRSGRPLQRRHS